MDVIDVDVVKLFKATGHEARITGLVLALLETMGYSDVPCGPEVLGMSGEHIQSYREQFRQALGLAQSEVVYEEEESSKA